MKSPIKKYRDPIELLSAGNINTGYATPTVAKYMREAYPHIKLLGYENALSLLCNLSYSFSAELS